MSAPTPPPQPPAYPPAGYPPPQPPAGYPPPQPPQPPAGYPPTGYPPSAPSGGKLSPAVIILAVVAAVVVLGAIVFVVLRVVGGGDDTVTAPPAAGPEVITPVPDAPQPSVEPIPDAPAPEPAPTTPAPPPPPPPPPPAEPTGSSDSIELGGGIRVQVPQGWRWGVRDSFVAMGDDENAVLIFPTSVPAGTQGLEVALLYAQEGLANRLSGVEINEPQPLRVANPSIVSTAIYPYAGTLVLQQGSINVQGVVAVMIRGDGAAIILDWSAPAGNRVPPEVDQVILQSIVQSM